MSKRNLYLGLTVLGLLGLNSYVKTDGFEEKVKEIKQKNIEETTTVSKSRNLETWVETFQDSSFNLEDKNYYWGDYRLYDMDDNGSLDGLVVVFNSKIKQKDSPWTGAVGYFELDKEDCGKINPKATMVYPFKKWDSKDYGKGLKDTNGDKILDEVMNFNETREFSEDVHYKPNKKVKSI